MKLRIRGNSLRFRLTKSEVVGLNEQGWWQDTTSLGPNGSPSFIYRIEAADTSTIRSEGTAITAVVAHAQMQTWAASSSEVGIYFETTWGTKVAIEKDFRCLDEKRDEDESDNFDNPNAGTSMHSGCCEA